MPENYFGINANQNSSSGSAAPSDQNPNQVFPNQPPPVSSPAPGMNEPQAPAQRFAPPAPDVFIRTSESDMDKMRAAGGEAQTWQSPPQPAFTPPEPMPSFSPPSPMEEFHSPVAEIPSEPSFAGPAMGPQVSASEFTNFPEFSQPLPAPAKGKKIVPLAIIIGIIIVGVVLGYFFLWPRFFPSQTPPTTTTTQTTVATTTTTLPPSPYPQISGPYQKNLIPVVMSRVLVLHSLLEAGTDILQPPGTFSILIPQYREYTLTSEEVVLSLIPNLPKNLEPYVLGRKFLVYSYYGEVNPSLGLIVDIGQDNIEDVKTVFTAWEKGKILEDLSNFWLVKVPKKSAKTFQEETTIGAGVRYFTYAGKEAAISYGFLNDYLIISSSLESINSAISHLQGATEPIYP